MKDHSFKVSYSHHHGPSYSNLVCFCLFLRLGLGRLRFENAFDLCVPYIIWESKSTLAIQESWKPLCNFCLKRSSSVLSSPRIRHFPFFARRHFFQFKISLLYSLYASFNNRLHLFLSLSWTLLVISFHFLANLF